MTMPVIMGTLELGIIYAIMALGVFISFRILDIPDLTVDSSFTLGAAVSAVMCQNSNPAAGILLSVFAGAIAGCITALLHTKLKIQPLLASILTMLGLYSINLRVMGRPNIPLINTKLIFDKYAIQPVFPALAFLIVSVILIFIFLKTKLGFAVRATGDNSDMVKSSGINADTMKIIGLALANGLVGLSGGLIAQYQGFADINMGVGMVVIGLACVIIGEVVFGKKKLLRQIIAVALGSVLYRFVIAVVFQLGLSPTDMKLLSALVVTAALAIPVIKEKYMFMRSIRAAEKKEGVADASNTKGN